MVWHHKDHPGFWRRTAFVWKFLGIVLVIAAGLSVFYALSLLGPRASDRATTRYQLTDEVAALQDQSREYERQYREVTQTRPPSQGDLERLERAIELQQQYLREVGGYDRQGIDRLQELQALQQNHLTEPLIEESRELEVRSARALGEGKAEEGASLLSEAFQIQKRINENYPLSQHNNLRRYTELERRLHELHARPLMERSIKAEQEAQEAMETERWVEARTLLREALVAQRQLNRDYSNMRYANVPRTEQLENRLASLESADLHQEIEDLVVEATAKEEAGRSLEAASTFQQAVRLQRELNEQFSRSRFASMQRLDQLEQRQRAAVSKELADEIIVEVGTVNTALRERRVWQAVEMLERLYRKAERFHENYPRNPQVDSALVTRLQYLYSMRDQLSTLQDLVYVQLLPIPDASQTQMAKTEVTQSLYEAVMGSNPSRSRGDTLPVVSLTWQEAQEFCLRLGWVLARPVRLPDLAEYRLAVGSLRYVDLNAISWNAGNSDAGSMRPVGTAAANANGFHDLLGNAAEWLAETPASGVSASDAQVIGGSIQTPTDRLVELAPEVIAKRERNRVVGFRYVVEVADD